MKHVILERGEVYALPQETLDALLRQAEQPGAVEAAIQRAAVSGPGRRPSSESGGAVAVVPIVGIIEHRATVLQMLFGIGTTTVGFAQAFRTALNDPAIGAVVVDVDSPGGSVQGTQELADTIYRARGRKPVVAVANSRAASAAYWIASQADELVVTPSGEVGGIGVFAVHDDVSRMAERLGVRRTYIAAGKYKTEANPFAPLSAEARVWMQKRVDGYYDAFASAVARGRRVTVDTVRNGMGQGRMVGARDAVGLRMADRVATLGETLERLAARISTGRGSAAHEGGRAWEVYRRRMRLWADAGGVGPAPRRPDRTGLSPDEDLEIRRRRLRLAEAGSDSRGR